MAGHSDQPAAARPCEPQVVGLMHWQRVRHGVHADRRPGRRSGAGRVRL